MRCGACVCDFAGDALFFVEVKKQGSKPWVARLSTPYTVFFALACAASLAAMVTKTRLLVLKLRSRLEGAEGPNVTNRKRLSVGGVPIAPVVSAAVARSDSTIIIELKSKFDDLRLQRQLAYCHIASALLEDLPPGKRRQLGHCNLPFAIGVRISLADLCRHHEHDLPRGEHPGVCRSRAGLRADARESLQPRAIEGHCCPLAEHLDKRCNARLQSSTYALHRRTAVTATLCHFRSECCTRLCRSTALNAFVEPHFAAEAEILRSQRNETKKLEAERSALIAELEATLSPQAVSQVQAAMQRQGSRGNLLSSQEPSQGEPEVAIDD